MSTDSIEVEARELPRWARALAVVVGVISVAAGILVATFPALGVLFVVYMVAFALILLGVERLGMGITGHAYVVRERARERQLEQPPRTTTA